jgi:hypothetical protein
MAVVIGAGQMVILVIPMPILVAEETMSLSEELEVRLVA